MDDSPRISQILRALRKHHKNLLTSSSSEQGVAFGMCFHAPPFLECVSLFLPGIVDRIEFTSDNSTQLATAIYMFSYPVIVHLTHAPLSRTGLRIRSHTALLFKAGLKIHSYKCSLQRSVYGSLSSLRKNSFSTGPKEWILGSISRQRL